MKIKLAVVAALLTLGIGGLILFGSERLAGTRADRTGGTPSRQVSMTEDPARQKNADQATVASNVKLSTAQLIQVAKAGDAATSHGRLAQAAASGATTRTLVVRVIWRKSRMPVPQAQVCLTWRARDQIESAPPVVAEAQTTTQGAAFIKYPGSLRLARLEVLHPQGAIHRAVLDLPMEQPLEVQLKQGSRVFGTAWLEKGDPAVGAEVSVLDTASPVPTLRPLRQGTTDKDGSYSIGQIPGGVVKLIATRGALSSALKENEMKPITLVAGEDSGPHDLTLRAGNDLTGIVRDQATKAPIAGAEIKSWNLNPLTNKEMKYFKEQSTRSSADGVYKLEGLPQEDLYIQASAEDYVKEYHTLHPAEGENFHDFDLEPGARVEVLVTDDQQHPIEGARLSGSQLNLGYSFSENTDAAGKALLKGISRSTPPDIYAIKEGYKTSGSERPQFTPGQSLGKVKLVLKPLTDQGWFSGRVSGASGEPLGGIRVRAGSLTLKLSDKGEAMTDANGAYRLAVKARDERYVLSASTLGRDLAPAWHGDLTPGTAEKPAEVNFTLGPGHRLHGTVVNTAGDPIPVVMVKVCTPERYFIYDGMPLDERMKITDEAGSFEFRDLPAGKVGLILEARGWVKIYRKQVPVDQEARIVLTPIGAIAGRVIDAQSSEAIPTFTVKITGDVQQESGYHDIYSNRKSFTAGDGRFTLEEIDPRGNYEVSVEADGYASELKQGLKAVSADKVQEILFSLNKGDTLKGRLVDARSGAPLPGLPVMYGFYSGGYFSWSRVVELSGLKRTQTDATGSFTFQEGAQKGALLVRAPGYSRRIVMAAERAKYTNGAELVIPLEPQATLDGTYSLAGISVTNVPICLALSGSGDGQSMEFTKSDLQGKYRWESLAAGDYRLWFFTKRISVTRKVRLQAGERKQVDLIGDFGALTLQGRVVDPSGKPRQGLYVSLQPAFPTDYDDFSCETDPEGGYRMDGLAAGDYTVRLSPPSAGPTPPPSKTEGIHIQGNSQRDFIY